MDDLHRDTLHDVPHGTAPGAAQGTSHPIAPGLAADTGYLIWQVQARLKQQLEARLAGARLSLSQYSALSLLNSRPGMAAADLARELPITPQAVSNLVVRLEALGYLARELPTIGRNQPLRVTAAGVAALAEAAPLVAAEERAFFAALTDAERSRLHALVATVLTGS